MCRLQRWEREDYFEDVSRSEEKGRKEDRKILRGMGSDMGKYSAYSFQGPLRLELVEGGSRQ
jgi:hypothetical protein